MSRETRLVVTLVAIAVVGVTALAVVANQYRKRVALPSSTDSTPGDSAATRAARLVDGFVEARRAVHVVVAKSPGTMRQLTAAVTGDFSRVKGQQMRPSREIVIEYRIARYDAFTGKGLTYEDYVAVRTAWRTWSEGGPVPDASLAAAFEARRADLDQAGLGEFEPYDDAVK